MLYFKILKIHSGDLLAFTRIGSVNTRICPVNARVSIALTSLNLLRPADSSCGDSTLAVWAAAQRLA